ncbi:hypothetical protein [Catalinimonas niigatensis]|uniref:hypothetical protein n=1 Tax=Catalinimonas niigatensis TaxID=1397264 RepID=UPI00266586CD|nr:hypothetical protein [Catalinimonas niigatensis]WPP48559.1 hypothetical protein PZB72_17965 [Catalinimonas niigatensis]
MQLDDLKKQWQQEQLSKSTEQIQQMIRGRSSSVSAQTERKALIETIAFVLVLIVFFTGLDPDKNSLWVNLLFLGVVSMGIANNLWLYRSLNLNRHGQDLHTSLQNMIRRLWVQIQFSVAFSVLFFTSIIIFLQLRVPLTSEKLLLILVLLGLSILIRSGVEIRKWISSIRKLNGCLEALA